MKRTSLALVVCALVACGDDDGTADVGVEDAGVDAPLMDGGTDAGDPDAGDPDAGDLDAGEDAGDPDAGDPDAGDLDAGSDAGDLDAGADAGDPDAGFDAGSDAGFDAGPTDCPTDCSELDDECNMGVCNTTTFVCETSPLGVGIACGDATDDECTMPDTCDGAGTCLSNHIAADTPCGDATVTECDLADTCDGAGTCGTNLVAAGTPCGSATPDVDCNLADTCDGTGLCDTNVAMDGDACSDCPAGLPLCAGCMTGVCEDVPGSTCIQGTLMLATPVMGDTSTAFSFYDPSCGGPSDANDHIYEFTAPSEGFFSFDTIGSAYDTVLSVHMGADDCTGVGEIACNDDIGGGVLQSEALVRLASGDRVTVNVNGFNTESGMYTLTATQIVDTCPTATDLGMATGDMVAMGMNASGSDLRGTTCQGNTGQEVYFTWTAPADGTYTFSTNGSDYDTVLAILDDCGVAGAELACDDDGGTGLQSSVTIPMTSGETVIIQLDAFGTNTGNYVLGIRAS